MFISSDKNLVAAKLIIVTTYTIENVFFCILLTKNMANKTYRPSKT